MTGLPGSVSTTGWCSRVPTASTRCWAGCAQRAATCECSGPSNSPRSGPSTAAALRAFHLDADLVPPEFRSEALAAALADQVAGQRVLLARADRGREVLREEAGEDRHGR